MQAHAAMTDTSFDEDISFDTAEYAGKKQLDELKSKPVDMTRRLAITTKQDSVKAQRVNQASSYDKDFDLLYSKQIPSKYPDL